MLCPDCHGTGWRAARVRITGNFGVAKTTQRRPCEGCGGSGIASCCEGMCGRADEVTNAPAEARDG